MEHQLWKEILAEVTRLDKSRRRNENSYTDGEIVLTWFWAVLHDRPVSWACQRANWPIHLRRRPIPSASRLSRRMSSESVQLLLQQVEASVLAPQRLSLVWLVDGKPLPVSKVTKDRQAGPRQGAKGYKLHALVDATGSVKAWRITPLGKDEKEMARRRVQSAALQGYLVADGNYDASELYDLCEEQGNLRLLTPLRASPGNRRRKRQSAGRQRSIQRQDGLRDQDKPFVIDLFRQRGDIERYFGNLTSWGGGLTHLPPWVRTHRRVHRWVQAKLILNALRRRTQQRTYSA